MAFVAGLSWRKKTPKGTRPNYKMLKVNLLRQTVCYLSLRCTMSSYELILQLQCTVPKYRAAVDYTPRLRASRNLLRCMANSDTCEAVANNYPGTAIANSYPGMTST